MNYGYELLYTENMGAGDEADRIPHTLPNQNTEFFDASAIPSTSTGFNVEVPYNEIAIMQAYRCTQIRAVQFSM